MATGSRGARGAAAGLLLAFASSCGDPEPSNGGGGGPAGGGWGAPQVLGEGGEPQVAVGRDGSALAVWLSGFGSSASALTASRLDASSGWGPAEPLSGPAHYFALEAGLGGSALVAWNARAASSSVWARWFRPGTGWTAAELLSTASSADPYSSQASVAVDRQNHGWVAWGQVERGTHRIWAARYDPTGAAGPAAVASAGAGNASRVRVRADERGGALVVWRAYRDGLNRVLAARFVEGQGWGGAVTLAADPGFDLSFSHIEAALSPAGDGLVVWTGFTGPGETGEVWAARLVAALGWEAPRQIGPTAAMAPGETPASLPRIEIDDEGAGLVVWRQSPECSLCPNADIWTNRFTPSAGWQQPQRLDPGPSYPPAVAVNAAGLGFAAWFRGGPLRVRSSRFEPAGGWGSPVDVGNAPFGYLPLAPDVGADDHGQAVVVWSQPTGPSGSSGPFQVLASRFTLRP